MARERRFWGETTSWCSLGVIESPSFCSPTTPISRKAGKHRAEIAGELPDMIARNQMRKEAREEKTLSGEFRQSTSYTKKKLTN